MEPTQGNLSALFRGFDARFKRALSLTVTTNAARIVRRAEGVSSSEDYPMSGLLGDLVEQVDEVYTADIWKMVQRATPTRFSAALPIDKDDILDDKYQIYQGPIDDLALKALTHISRNVASTLVDGFSDTWAPDGSTVFSDSHEWAGGESWDNKLTVSLDSTNFDTACQQLEEMTGPDGEPLGLSPKLLVVGPSNRATAEGLVKVRTNSNGADNRQYQRTDLIVLPRITGSHWFVVDDNPYDINLDSDEVREVMPDVQVPKPLLADIRQDVETESQTSSDSDYVFENDKYRYKASLRYALMILAPWMIVGSTG